MIGATGIAALAAGAAMWLMRPPRSRAWSRLDRRLGSAPASEPGAERGPSAPAIITVAALLGCAAGLLVAGPAAAAPASIAAAPVGWRMLAGRAARKRAAVEEAVPEFCTALAGELRTGRPPAVALAAAADAAPSEVRELLAPAVGVARLGGDVVGVLRSAAMRPGAEALQRLAACWQVAAGLGAAPGPALRQLAAAEQDRLRHRGEVAAELAGVRATAAVLAGLPVVGLALGTSIGGKPWSFLLHTVPGAACLAVGAALEVAGLAWTDRLAARASRI